MILTFLKLFFSPKRTGHVTLFCNRLEENNDEEEEKEEEKEAVFNEVFFFSCSIRERGHNSVKYNVRRRFGRISFFVFLLKECPRWSRIQIRSKNPIKDTPVANNNRSPTRRGRSRVGPREGLSPHPARGQVRTSTPPKRVLRVANEWRAQEFPT